MTLFSRAELAALGVAEDRPDRRTPVQPATLQGLSAAGERVAVVLQPGSVPVDKQLAAVMKHCDARGYTVVALVRSLHEHDAVELIRSGGADLIVAALPAKAGGATKIEDDVTALGSRVEYTREPRKGLRRSVNPLIAKLAAEGLAPDVVARVLGLPEDDVRQALSLQPAERPAHPSGVVDIGERRRAKRRRAG